MTKRPRKLGCVFGFTLLLGVFLVLVGLCINLAWFLYLASIADNPGEVPFNLQFFIANLLPGLSLLAIAIFVSYFSTKRSQKIILIGLGGLFMLFSFIWAILGNLSLLILLSLKPTDFEHTEGLNERTESPSSASTPQEMFRYIIRDPIPVSISNLQGVGDTWQGYGIYLRFQASKSDINSIVASGYKPIKCSAIADRFKLPKGYNNFKPSWKPNLSSNKQCYQANDIKNGWTSSGSHYLVIDPKSGTVYFYGIGA